MTKCHNCGYEAPIYDFLDEYLGQHENEDGSMPEDFEEYGGKACPKCKTEQLKYDSSRPKRKR